MHGAKKHKMISFKFNVEQHLKLSHQETYAYLPI